MDITEGGHIVLRLMGNEFYIQDTVFFSYMITIAVSLFAFFINYKVKQVKVEDTPSGVVNIMEMAIEALNKMVSNTMGERNIGYAPYILTLALYLAPSNLIGLIGFTPPTTNLNITLALSMITFVLIHAKSIQANGVKAKLKSYIEPSPILMPMNVIGDLATPISLSFRLFGNVLSGVIIMSLIYGALGMFSPLITPVLHAYFDIFAGLLQTFIFCMLTMVNIAMAD